MGTSRGLSTPKGGAWGKAKREITGHLGNANSFSPAQIVSSVVSAMGGLGLGIEARAGSSGEGSSGGGTRSAAAQTQRIGRAISGLGGFVGAVQDHGLAAALERLDLAELDGRPAVEVISRVSERLADGIDGIDGEILKTAFNEAILEAAQLQGELGFTDLEAALQAFLATEGLSGMIELFLTRFVTDLVTGAILDHVEKKTISDAEMEALLSGIEIACRAKVHSAVERHRSDGRFNNVDWFGSSGAQLGRELSDAVITELRAT